MLLAISFFLVFVSSSPLSFSLLYPKELRGQPEIRDILSPFMQNEDMCVGARVSFCSIMILKNLFPLNFSGHKDMDE